MSWTFLYRSSDCFSSSILRSCKRQLKVNFSKLSQSWTTEVTLLRYKANCNLSNVPSLHWLPSTIQLPFSSSALPHLARKEKWLQTKNGSVYVGLDNRPEHTGCSWRIKNIQTSQAATLLIVIPVTSQPVFVFKSPSDWYATSSCEQAIHFSRTFSLQNSSQH